MAAKRKLAALEELKSQTGADPQASELIRIPAVELTTCYAETAPGIESSANTQAHAAVSANLGASFNLEIDPALSDAIDAALNDETETVPNARLDGRLNTQAEGEADATAGAAEGADQVPVNNTLAASRRADPEARRDWKYVCDYPGCGNRFNRPSHLDSHIRTHTGERPFACPHEDCEKDFNRKDHLQRHLAHSHGVPPQREHACDWEGCGKSFTTKIRLQRHKETHGTKFYCNKYGPCQEFFRKEKTLEAHVKKVHIGIKPYTCPFVDPDSKEKCTHGYQTESALRKHLAAAHKAENVQSVYMCPACLVPGADFEAIRGDDGELFLQPTEHLSFSNADELKAHEAEVHPPTCTECSQVFKTTTSLNSHVRSVHTDLADQVTYQCSFEDCGKLFNRKHNLQVHVEQVHEKYRPWVCGAEAMQGNKHPNLRGWDGENACGKLYKAKSTLEQHIRRTHLGHPNRKDTRNSIKRPKFIPDPMALNVLTGAGYEDGRNIACIFTDCSSRFAREQDLKRHLTSDDHGLSSYNADVAIFERTARSGGQFWVGGDENCDSRDPSASVDPSLPETPASMFEFCGQDTIIQPNGYEGFDPDTIDPSLEDAFNASTFDLSNPEPFSYELTEASQRRLNFFKEQGYIADLPPYQPPRTS